MRKRNKVINIEHTDTEIAVKLEGVTKIYENGFANEFPAANNISLEIKKGEFVAIVGTSGSGKSTLMHMIAGVEKPTKGKVYISGCNIYELNDETLSYFRCKEIGIVFQFFNLIPVINIEENIAYPLVASGRMPDFKKITEILKQLGLQGKGSYLPSQLSGGQQQRVAIARLIASSPSLILADEPTGNLDSKNSREVIGLLKNICKEENKTLIIITHDESIAATADRIIRIEDGAIVSDINNKKAVM